MTMYEFVPCTCAALRHEGASPAPCRVHGWNGYRHNAYSCDIFWGSHGCSLEYGHVGPCVCDDREIDTDGERIGDIYIDNGTPAVPPYYGPGTEFFSNNGQHTPPLTLSLAERNEGWNHERKLT